MKKLHFENGGRCLFNNDLDLLQKYTDFVGAGILKEKCVLKGVEKTFIPYTSKVDLTSGIVYLNNKFLEFEGVEGVESSGYLVESEEVLSNLKPYETGGTFATRSESKAIYSETIPDSGEYISVSNITYFEETLNVVTLKNNQVILGEKTFTKDITVKGTEVKSTLDSLSTSVTDLQNDKADTSYVNSRLNTKATIGTHSWNQCTIKNGFTGSLSICKDDFGMVHLSGSIYGGGSSNSNAASFYSSFAPYHQLRIPITAIHRTEYSSSKYTSGSLYYNAEPAYLRINSGSNQIEILDKDGDFVRGMAFDYYISVSWRAD